MNLVPPSIVSLPGDGRVIITEGMNLDLLCNTTGNPRPNVTWSRDGAVVRPGSGKCGEGCVRLEGVMSSAGGMYTCRADNGIPPAAVASTQVVVQCKFKFLIHKECPINLRVTHIVYLSAMRFMVTCCACFFFTNCCLF